MTAHWRRWGSCCPITEFGACIGGSQATVHVVAADGVATRSVPIDLGNRPPPMMHNGQLTNRWIVVMDLSLVFLPEAMMKSENRFPIVFDKERKARFGLLPVDATENSAMVWFEMDESLFIFHIAAAWDEGDDTVVLWASTMDYVSLSLTSDDDIYETQLNKFTFNTATGVSTRTRFPLPNWGYGTAPPSFDFATTHPSMPTTRRRYTYGM